jgi:hypothetical protein
MRFFRVLLPLAFIAGAAALGATPLRPAFDLQGPGLSIAHAGAGLLGGPPRSLVVNLGGPVELALLYWAGRDRPCFQAEPGGPCLIPEGRPYKDQLIQFAGVAVEGVLLGTEAQRDTNAGPINNIAYMADVTRIVRARGTGRQAFPVGNIDPTEGLADLDGAGLLVIYTDPAVSTPARILIHHGVDFAYGEDRTPGETQVTEPFTFNHGAARASTRKGRLVLFAADAVGLGPDRIDISRNPSLVDRLDGSSGPSWDADSFSVDVPAGAMATTVQVFSEPVGRNPDSLLWVMAALWLPLPVPSGCAETFWSGSTAVWGATGTKPGERVVNLFTEARGYSLVATSTLQDALRFRREGGLVGAAKAVVRAGVAAYLNAGHPKIEYPLTRTQVITRVDTALRSFDPETMFAVARGLEEDNGEGCPLD